MPALRKIEGVPSQIPHVQALFPYARQQGANPRRYKVQLVRIY